MTPPELQRVVAVIPARGGSQRIPGKNLAPLAGRPLLSYTIEAARRAHLVSEVYVSTDSDAIAEVARQQGVAVVDRPAELATAEAPTEPALFHAVSTIERGGRGPVDVIVLLQPTSPLRSHRRVDEAIDLLLTTGCDSVVGVVADIGYYFLGDIDAQGQLKVGYDPHQRLRTQRIPPRYRENGAVYVMTRQQHESIDIDDWLDLRLCETILEHNSAQRRPSTKQGQAEAWPGSH